MKFYSFDEIKEAADCRDVMENILNMIPTTRSRNWNNYNCPWRPTSDSGAFQVSEQCWTDHTKPKGASDRAGNVITLLANAKYNSNIQQAQMELGERYNLTPKNSVRQLQHHEMSRIQQLKRDGYKLETTYKYRDKNGNEKHYVERWTHPKKKKEFLQRTNEKYGVKIENTYLYHYNEWHNSSWLCIAEGEKDVDTLTNWEYPATTNPSGGGTWTNHYTEMVRDKKIVIIEDNDEAGRKRGAYLAWQLKNAVPQIKRVRFPDLPESGDITDFKQRGGTKADFEKILSNAKSLDLGKIPNPGKEYEMLQTAKKANQKDFSNYVKVKDENGNTRKVPRYMHDLIDDIHKRFLYFPRLIGDVLFDHDRDKNKIIYLNNSRQLFAWIQRKSHRHVRWARVEGAVGKEELFEALHDEGRRYESISTVPDFPKREDVYYTHSSLPKSSTNYQYFNKLIEGFNPISVEDKIMIKSFVTAPIFFKHSIPRPLWVINSEAPQSGKTTLANLTAHLYGSPALGVQARDFARDIQQITKRLVSSSGRNKRVFLVDNVVGAFHSPEFSGLITEPYITGMRPYGRGEENRPNDLTYVVTSNDAVLSNDLTIRAYFIQLQKPTRYSSSYLSSMLEYIEKNRMQIFADLLEILRRHEPFEMSPRTRFPEFETQILQAHCKNKEEYSKVIDHILHSREDANIEQEWGARVQDAIQDNLIAYQIDPEYTNVWIRTEIIKQWVKKILPDINKNRIIQMIREFARCGHASRLDSKRIIWPTNGPGRRRGIGWMAEQAENTEPDIALGIKQGKITILDREDKPIHD